ncbi:MAG: hypothetical protein RLO81_20190 [Fulvivirga sp.]|uniref:hypothetical protein n=1 Tax=Fulvivirga sp. TaxID=1931237 RepID=UPI0032EAC126
MKNYLKLSTLALILVSMTAYAQKGRLMQYERPVGKDGINIYEAPKADTIEFEGDMKVRVGGDYSILFQGLSQENDATAPEQLVDLSSNFALPTANLNIDVQIKDGLRMHVRTYLSSRHHPEAWVKGGYFQVDNLDFIKEGLLSGVMEKARFRFGMNDINYGDTHFRRSDNARSMYNPFVGNYIMDAFTTEPFAEISYFPGDLFAVLGISNGRLNQAPVTGDDGHAVYAKLGYDKQVNDDLRFRLTGSYYSSSERSTRDYLYNGDRAGARYYNVLEGVDNGGSDFDPRFNPRFGYQNSIMINPSVIYGGFEFFGLFETVENGDDDIGGSLTHLGAEALYRFGGRDQLYFGARFNQVDGELADGAPSITISRTNIGGGWFLTDHVMTKIEYVTSKYEGDGFIGDKRQGAEFDGFVIEAVISF